MKHYDKYTTKIYLTHIVHSPSNHINIKIKIFKTTICLVHFCMKVKRIALTQTHYAQSLNDLQIVFANRRIGVRHTTDTHVIHVINTIKVMPYEYLNRITKMGRLSRQTCVHIRNDYRQEGGTIPTDFIYYFLARLYFCGLGLKRPILFLSFFVRNNKPTAAIILNRKKIY